MTFTPFNLPIEPNAQILLDSTLSIQIQGISNPLAVLDPQNRPGWYYNSTLHVDIFKWSIFDGTSQNFTFNDVQNLTFTATHDNIPNNKCYIAIYSTASKIIYENDNVELIPGEKCLFYTNTPPANPEQLRLVKLNLVIPFGPCLQSETLLSISLEGNNIVSFPNVLKICVENIGYLFSQDTVPVVINLYTINGDVATLNTTLGITNTDLTILNGTLGTTNTDLGSLNTTLGTTNTDLGSLNTTLGTTNTDLTTLNGTLGTTNTDLGSLNTTLGITNTDLEALNTTLGTTNTDLGSLNTTLGITNTDLGSLNTTLGTTNTDLGSLNTTLGTTNTDLTTLNGTLGTTNTDLTTLNNTLQSGVITTSLPALNYDSFGRLRVSEPYTLVDSNFRFADNDLWATTNTNSSSVTFNANQGLMDLTVSTTTGSKVVRETFRVYSYQPGKSLLVLNSFVGSTVNGIQQKIGYFGIQNGVYLEITGTDTGIGTCSFIKRTSISGSVVNNTVIQSDWNGDKLNGTGPSGYTLVLSRPQLLWMDFEWLGVGSVRIGFIIDGQFILCHTFTWANNAGSTASTYMTTASLPLRYEIINNGGAGGTLKQICSTIISEGGYQSNGTQQSIATPLLIPVITAATPVPVISIRLTSGKLDAIVLITAMNLIPADTGVTTYFWQFVRGGTILGGTWIVPAYTGSSVDYNLFPTAGTITGGTIMASGFFSSTNQNKNGIDSLRESLFKYQLLRDGLTNTPIELTIVCSSIVAAKTSVYASLDWEEVTR